MHAWHARANARIKGSCVLQRICPGAVRACIVCACVACALCVPAARVRGEGEEGEGGCCCGIPAGKGIGAVPIGPINQSPLRSPRHRRSATSSLSLAMERCSHPRFPPFPPSSLSPYPSACARVPKHPPARPYRHRRGSGVGVRPSQPLPSAWPCVVETEPRGA